ncbi:MAG: hypothetical protein R2845_01265 [Thermomicrobiales bacterium]
MAPAACADSIGLLDQLSVSQEEAGELSERVITVEAVRSLLGISRNDRIVSLVTAIADRDAANALELVNAAVDAGDDARQINRQLVAYLRDLMFARAGAARDADEATQELAQRFSIAELECAAAAVQRSRLPHQALALRATPTRDRARRSGHSRHNADVTNA